MFVRTQEYPREFHDLRMKVWHVCSEYSSVHSIHDQKPQVMPAYQCATFLWPVGHCLACDSSFWMSGCHVNGLSFGPLLYMKICLQALWLSNRFLLYCGAC
jgi:hypothetical protein